MSTKPPTTSVSAPIPKTIYLLWLVPEQRYLTNNDRAYIRPSKGEPARIQKNWERAKQEQVRIYTRKATASSAATAIANIEEIRNNPTIYDWKTGKYSPNPDYDPDVKGFNTREKQRVRDERNKLIEIHGFEVNQIPKVEP